MQERTELGSLADPEDAQYRAPCDVAGYAAPDLLKLLRTMHLIRRVEEQIGTWVTTKVARCPCHLGIGQEAVAAGIAHALRPSDKLFGNHRSHAHYLAVGGDAYGLLAEVLGRLDGCSGGMGGSMHLIARDKGFLGSVPIVGGTIPIAVGAGLAAKMDDDGSIAVAYFGDGASEEGVLHESMNLAAIYELPVLFVCENNQYSSHLDIKLRQPSDRVSRYADAHRLTTAVVDGNDATGMANCASRVIGDMRRTRKPAFIEAVTYRWRGHVGANEDIDVGVRRSLTDVAAWKQRDPVQRLEKALLAAGLADDAQLRALRQEIDATVTRLAEDALHAPFPPASALLDLVYAR